MRRLLIALLAWCWSFGAAAQFASSDEGLKNLVVLCYHDVRDEAPKGGSEYVIEAAELVNQFSWLKENGYAVVTLQQVLTARDGKATLPAKPVLLTFDDGYRSFYTHVYPLLRLFRYPAVLAVVGSWVDNPTAGASNAPADAPLLGWDEIRALAKSGLVDIASHSYDLHHGIHANPQGNAFAAATARGYDAASGRYESDADYEERIRVDLARSADAIQRNTGIRPRAMVWPYGSYNLAARRIARELGMDISLGLDDHAPRSKPFGLHLGRVLMVGNPSMREFIAEMLRPYKPDPVRAVRVNLDDVFDAEPAVREQRLSQLIDRVAALGINTVYLNAAADTDGDGRIDQAYFPSRLMPMRADLFARVSWQLHTRARVKVFAWLPLRDVQLPSGSSAERGRAGTLHQELARYAPFDGLLFDDRVDDNDATYLATMREVERTVSLYRAVPRIARAITPASLRQAGGAEGYDPAIAALAGEMDQLVIRAADRRAPAASNMRALATRTSARAPGRAALVFELSGRDPSLVESLRALQLSGAADLSYDHDDFLRNAPALERVRTVMSLQSQPR